MEDQEGEYDSMVVEQAGEVLPAVARLVGPDTFAPYFAGFLPEILRRLVSLNPYVLIWSIQNDVKN